MSSVLTPSANIVSFCVFMLCVYACDQQVYDIVSEVLERHCSIWHELPAGLALKATWYV
jgi:hypothetical protein